MTDKNRRDVTPDDFDGPHDVPAYDPNAGGSTAANVQRPNIYERTGKAAPTEVFPNSGSSRSAEWVEPQPATASNETVALPREEPAPAPAKSGLYTDSYPDNRAAETEYQPEVAPVDEADSVVVEEPRARRGTIDFGLLLLRLLVGGYLIMDAVKIFFRLGGDEGITGLESAFANYPLGDILAVVLPTLELAAGVFLVLGLLGPVAAMVAVAVTGFFAAHAVTESGDGLSVLNWDANVWLPLLLLGASLALQFTGPGFYAVDAGRGWARRPLASSWIFAVLGIAAAVALWWFGAGVVPGA